MHAKFGRGPKVVSKKKGVTETQIMKLLQVCQVQYSAGSILDISKYRDTHERSISILGGIAILRYIEY